MKTLRTAIFAAASVALCMMTFPPAKAQDTKPATPISHSKQVPYAPTIINGETFLMINLAQLMDGRTAGTMDIDGDWISVTSRDASFLPFTVDGVERRVLKNPEITSSLKIMQVYYVPSGNKRLSYFDGKNFTACSPAAQVAGQKEDPNQIRYPYEDNWSGPGKDQFNKIDKHFIGFKIPAQAECGAAIWMIIVRAPERLQKSSGDLERLLIAAGDRLALNLQSSRDLLYKVRWGLGRSSVGDAANAPNVLFQPFHDAVTDCLLELGVDKVEQPKDATGWAKFKTMIGNFLEHRSGAPKKLVTDPAVTTAMTKVYLEANFLIAELEGSNAPGVEPAIEQLRHLSDDLNKSLGFSQSVSKSYCAVMDNAAWILDQLGNDHPYLGLAPEEKNYLRQMKATADEIRKVAERDGDPKAAEYVRQDFSIAWSGPTSEIYRRVVGKLFTNKSEDAVDLQTALQRLSRTLIDKCGDDSRCRGRFGL